MSSVSTNNPKTSERRVSQKFGIAFISAILLCVILNPLNSSTISVALPILLPALHTSTSGITWIVSGYYLGSAIAQPVMGKFGDVWGRARLIYIGFSLIIITAILAPFSRSLGMFIFWRVVQAIATSMVYPNAIGLLRQYRPGDTGRILGWIGTAMSISVAVGPTIGGFLIDLTSWHSIFWLNIPLAILSMVLLFWILPKGEPTYPEKDTVRRFQIDWGGMLLFATAIIFWILWSNTKHLFVTPEIFLLFLSLLLSVGLVLVEMRQTAPIIPVDWFRRPKFALSSGITVLANLVMYCILYGIPVFLETVRSFSTTKSGLFLLAYAGVLSLASPLGGRFAQGMSRRVPLILAGTLLLAGTLILCWIDILPIFALVLALALIGVSFAISNVVIQQIFLESAPKSQIGQASGVYTLMRYLGTIFSSALIGSKMSTQSGALTLFIILTIASAVTLALSLGVREEANVTSS